MEHCGVAEVSAAYVGDVQVLHGFSCAGERSHQGASRIGRIGEVDCVVGRRHDLTASVCLRHLYEHRDERNRAAYCEDLATPKFG